MLNTKLDLATNRLFGDGGANVQNIKLYPGTNRDTTVEDFSTEINKLISQIESGSFEEVESVD